MDARDLHSLSMTLVGDEYRISADKLDYLHVSVRNLVYSDSAWIDRFDLAALDLHQATLKVHMVFGVYPMIDVDDLHASGLQVTLEGMMDFGGDPHPMSISFFEVPLSLSGLPRSHSNGVAMKEADSAHRLFVPAPMTTLMGTLMA
jgi:hypothetical protein